MELKLSERIYNDMIQDILKGNYSARDFISEAQIAAKYQVSKAPVKEALHNLANEGYLVSYPKRGYMINTYSREEINKIQDIRRVLEAYAVQKAIQNASDEKLEALRFYRTEEELQYSPSKSVNARFHLGLAEASGNEYLVEVLRPLVLRASMYNIEGKPDTANFDRILDAMKERDTEKALRMLEEDIRYL
ncbi:MAG: GntR family transcriptional regulator [Mogibacterium sp.]|nr:GntR family transcriptional regulator [Mogibacterium sp.]